MNCKTKWYWTFNLLMTSSNLLYRFELESITSVTFDSPLTTLLLFLMTRPSSLNFSLQYPSTLYSCPSIKGWIIGCFNSLHISIACSLVCLRNKFVDPEPNLSLTTKQFDDIFKSSIFSKVGIILIDELNSW